jgi:paraquat-inducible protein A
MGTGLRSRRKAASPSVRDATAPVSCRLCGLQHQPVRLALGERALCVRCDSVLATGSRLGTDATLVFSLTGLALSVPAMLLPFVGAGTLGDNRVSHLFTGVSRFWRDGMGVLAVVVFVCGWLLPVALLSAFAIVDAAARWHWRRTEIPLLFHVARILERWAIPEVQVLAILVAFTKLGSVVTVRIGPGFWCYCAMALSLLIARHSFEFDSASPLPALSESDTVSPR